MPREKTTALNSHHLLRSRGELSLTIIQDDDSRLCDGKEVLVADALAQLCILQAAMPKQLLMLQLLQLAELHATRLDQGAQLDVPILLRVLRLYLQIRVDEADFASMLSNEGNLRETVTELSATLLEALMSSHGKAAFCSCSSSMSTLLK